MTTKRHSFTPVGSEDARKIPVRVAEIQEDERFAVRQDDEPTVMSFPHLVLREAIALLSMLLFLVLLSLFADAPLEEIANSAKTPNPAKAPWYFLGLQELLHYYPPFVAGVLLPGIVVMALVQIPYFEVNLKREALWTKPRPAHATLILVIALAVAFIFNVAAQHTVWPIVVPTLVVGGMMALPGYLGAKGRVLSWLSSRSLPFYVFFWFLSVAVVLTVIGTLFRGPGWAFTLPWREGIY
jgi:menaquinol-cytochrome c reductase cytochrome b/c subunit